ncbi:MAG: helix-hairpin-helix domain-containing protein [Clostridia bacterium]|nr:helix-hairpin-helix domain-containing protein [Clostridia bacterium]
MSEKKHEFILATLGLILVGVIIITAAFDIPGLFADTDFGNEKNVIVITTAVKKSNTNENNYESEESTTVKSVEKSSDFHTLININTATVEELTGINNIGLERANAIIEYREQFGDFDSVEEITNIYGIGENTLEEIRDYISVY